MSTYLPEHIKLIFNPAAGRSDASPAMLQNIISALQSLDFIPEVYLVEHPAPGGEDTRLQAALGDALRRDIRTFVICGGDGTIETISRHLTGKHATLGIIPAGTQNNISLSLGIPAEIDKAAALLRTGIRRKIDIGIASASGGAEYSFLEVCAVGLFSALFEPADNLQKGNLAGLGGILSTLASFPLANIHITFPRRAKTSGLGQVSFPLRAHAVMVANLPYFGLNYRAASDSSPDDGLLDVLIFPDFTTLELVGNLLQSAGSENNDARILRFRASALEIHCDPALPAQADGAALGSSPVRIRIERRALSVITGLPGQPPPRAGFLHNLNLTRFFKH